MASADSTVRRALKAAARRVPEVFAPGSRVVVGLSGGQDSTCLVHALSRYRDWLNLEVVAGHVDHALRPESAADALRVAELAEQLGVLSVVRRVDVARYRRQTRWSVQQAARVARYQALASIAAEYGATAVLVAHSADDQAETLLLHLLRGSGLGGLAAMRLDETVELSQLGPPLFEVGPRLTRMRLVRPFLAVPRATTLAYCAERGLSIVEDASNQSRVYTRNRVRLDLLPALERFNPAIRSVLARTAELAGEDVAALDALVEEIHAGLCRDFEYDLRLWRAQPRAFQRRLLRYGLLSLLGDLVDVRASPIEDALEVVQSGRPGQTYHLPYGVELTRGSDSFVLRVHGRARARDGSNTQKAKVSRV